MDEVISIPKTSERACDGVAKGFLAIEGSAETAIEAIELCGSELERQGYVTGAFARDCIEREVSYPTGICTDIPVALPHCKSDAIITSALCYLRLDSPVRFARMDDEEEFVETRHIFNLAIAPGDHLEFLSKTMQLLADPAVLSGFENKPIGEVAEYLKTHLS
ncbi:PTS sugar transporter subunit IIA [Collinsella aerofaciens]|uniref:PTS sugar transporter subunit IIA n=1 Tax=Collinsella aerofaciens TaxID=74426 RepID=UPI002FAADE82